MALAQALVLVLLASWLTSFTLAGLLDALIAVVVISGVLALAWPLVSNLAARVHPLIFPFAMLALTGALVAFVDRLLPGIHVDTIWSGILIAIGLFAASTIFGTVIGREDDLEYDRFVVRSIRRFYSRMERTGVPGAVFVEIDGLAEPVLREALAAGQMPTLKRWLDRGSHRLIEWEPDLSSQTSASQAGILLGDNTDIPAFRWYDKQTGEVVVSSRFRDAAAVEHHLSRRIGLLAPDGASRLNMMSGDAGDCLFTFSTFRSPDRKVSSRDYYAYFSNPYNIVRVVSLFVADAVAEVWYGLRQRLHGGPRVRRGGVYPFVRAATTSFMLELSMYMALRDVLRGVPTVYTTIFAYDEIAHHSGIRAPDAIRILTRIDRLCRRLERAAAHAPRPYDLVVLSDHGQSEGATFRQRFGKPLSTLVDELTGAVPVAAAAEGDEHVGALSLVVSEAVATDARTARVLRRLLRGRTVDGTVTLGPDESALQVPDSSPDGTSGPATAAPRQDGRAVVLASGNLGLIYFTAWPERMTFEEITDAFPDLLPALARHPGIGFVRVRSAVDGELVLGARGIHYLDKGDAVGEDPLAPFGPNAAIHLRRHAAFANTPDILVNSCYDPATEETAAFEELLGNHGGLGGPQTRPFVLYPIAFGSVATPIVGAPALHRQLCRWLQETQGRPHPALSDKQDEPIASPAACAPVAG
jgi:uncharacterized membrane protein YvlD (DUF360 family)